MLKIKAPFLIDAFPYYPVPQGEECWPLFARRGSKYQKVGSLRTLSQDIYRASGEVLRTFIAVWVWSV